MRAVRSSTASAAASVSCNPPCSSWYLVTALAIVVLHVLGDAFDAFGVALGQLHVYGRRRCFAVRGVAQGLAGVVRQIGQCVQQAFLVLVIRHVALPFACHGGDACPGGDTCQGLACVSRARVLSGQGSGRASSRSDGWRGSCACSPPNLPCRALRASSGCPASSDPLRPPFSRFNLALARRV